MFWLAWKRSKKARIPPPPMFSPKNVPFLSIFFPVDCQLNMMRHNFFDLFFLRTTCQFQLKTLIDSSKSGPVSFVSVSCYFRYHPTFCSSHNRPKAAQLCWRYSSRISAHRLSGQGSLQPVCAAPGTGQPLPCSGWGCSENC